MNTLDQFLSPFGELVDVSAVLDPDVEKIQNTYYDQPSVYKYFAPERREFFERPQLRFSQREVLNDPFEMSRRWKAVRDDKIRDILCDTIRERVAALQADRETQLTLFVEHCRQTGHQLSEDQIAQASQYLQKRDFLAGAAASIDTFVDFVFSRLEVDMQKRIDDVMSKMGVLSVTADQLNETMWAHYAANGSGFAIGFDASQEPFLRNIQGTTRKLLRKVIYTNEWAETFWRNPYYLFLVKSTKWAYEQEWRMFKALSDCDERKVMNGQPEICLYNVKPQAIRDVYFGYAYETEAMRQDMSAIRRFGSNPNFFTVRANRETGVLETATVERVG